jgi:hypothetical protein
MLCNLNPMTGNTYICLAAHESLRISSDDEIFPPERDLRLLHAIGFIESHFNKSSALP